MYVQTVLDPNQCKHSEQLRFPFSNIKTKYMNLVKILILAKKTYHLDLDHN